MAYSTSAPPSLVTRGGIGNKLPNVWELSGTDAATTVRVSGYITNGGQLGMKVNDIVYYTKTDATPPALYVMNVVTVSATSPGAVDLSDPTTLASVNTD